MENPQIQHDLGCSCRGDICMRLTRLTLSCQLQCRYYKVTSSSLGSLDPRLSLGCTLQQLSIQIMRSDRSDMAMKAGHITMPTWPNSHLGAGNILQSFQECMTGEDSVPHGEDLLLVIRDGTVKPKTSKFPDCQRSGFPTAPRSGRPHPLLHHSWTFSKSEGRQYRWPFHAAVELAPWAFQLLRKVLKTGESVQSTHG